jgi:hypothetical protein
MPFELSQPAGDHQLAVRGRRIAQRSEASTMFDNSVEGVEQIAGAARQPIELGYQQHIPCL